MDFIKLIADFTGMKPDDIKKNIQKDDGSYADAAESYIQDLLKNKLEKLVFTDDKKREMAENFEKKGYAEAMKKVNTKLADLFPKAEITPEANIDDVIGKIKTTKVEPLPEDQIKLHPIFRELEKNTVPKSDYEKAVSEFESYKKDINRTQKLNKVKELAESHLVDYRMPEDPKLKQKRIDAFISQSFGGFDFEDDGNDFILMRDGKREEDEMRNAVTASRRIKEQADIFFDRKIKGTPPGTPPAGTPPPADPDKQKEPATVDEFNQVRRILEGKELVEYSKKYMDKFKG